jgi:hypothetical protein
MAYKKRAGDLRLGFPLVLGQLGAAVGVNRRFLFPYTLLARIVFLD